jgi:hypothetical protein
MIGAALGLVVGIIVWLPGAWGVAPFAVCVPGGFVLGLLFGREIFEHPVLRVFDWLGL